MAIKINSKKILLPELLKVVNKVFPNGTVFKMPNRYVYKICSSAVIDDKNHRICCKIMPDNKTISKMMAALPVNSKTPKEAFVLEVDHSWLFRQDLEILTEEKYG